MNTMNTMNTMNNASDVIRTIFGREPVRAEAVASVWATQDEVDAAYAATGHVRRVDGWHPAPGANWAIDATLVGGDRRAWLVIVHPARPD